MKTLVKSLIVLIVVAVAPIIASAAELEVVFTPDPLFSEFDYLPGDSASDRLVDVTNLSENPQTISFAVLDLVDNNELSSYIDLEVWQEGMILWQGSLQEAFLLEVIPLSDLPGISTVQYEVSAVLNPAASNDVQGASLSFDLWFGVSDDNEVSNEQPGNLGGFSGGGGSSGSFINNPIVISPALGQVLGNFVENTLDFSNNKVTSIKDVATYFSNKFGHLTTNSKEEELLIVPSVLGDSTSTILFGEEVDEAESIFEENCVRWWWLLLIILIISIVSNRLMQNRNTLGRIDRWKKAFNIGVILAIISLFILYLTGLFCLQLIIVLLIFILARLILQIYQK